MANEVVIDSRMNTSGVEAGAKRINQTMKNLEQTTKKTADAQSKAFQAQNTGEMTKEYALLDKELSRLGKRYDDIAERQSKFLNTGGKQYQFTDEYKTASNQVERLTRQLETLLNKRDKFEVNKVSENSNAYKSMLVDIARVSKQLELAEKEKERLESNKYTQTRPYASMEYDLDVLGKKIDVVKAKMQSMRDSGTAFVPESGGASTPPFESQTKAVTKYNSAIKTAFATAKKGVGIFHSLTSALKKQKSSFGGGFKSILKYAFGIRSVFVLVNKLRSALVSGFNNLAQFNGGVNPVNSALSSLKSSLTQLKNSFATAFAPILTTIAPILTTFINYLSDAITTLGMFFAKLTGANTFTKATKVQQQYATATQNSANAQEQLNNKLADYDKLAVVEQKNESSSSGGSGADTSGVRFETVEINDTATNWAEKFRQAWENADFTDIGRTVSQKLAYALDHIPWDDIQAKCDQIARSVGTFINGFVEGGALQSFGGAVANGLNVAMRTANTYLETVNWSALGTAITESVSRFFSTFSFSELGRTICNLIVAGLDLISGLINGINWRDLPLNIVRSIKDTLTGVNWGSLFSSLGNVAGSILSAIINFDLGLVEVLGDVAGKIKDYFVTKIREAGWSSDNTLAENGKAIIVGIFNGIISFLSNVGTWIRDNILNPFIEGFKTTFSIHSPTQDPTLVGFGTNIITGIFNGIITWMAGIKNWIKTNVLDKFVAGFNQAKAGMTGLALTISTKFAESKESLKQKWNDIASGVKNKVTTFKTKFAESKETLKQKWNDLKSVIKDKTTNFKFNFPSATEVKNKLKSIVNTIIGWLNANFISKLNSLFSITVPNNSITQFLGIAKKSGQIITIPNIPKLATGAVIPPNQKFLAMLGDQTEGVNIETPLATMIEAFQTALDSRGGGVPESIRVYLNESSNRPLAEAVWDEENKYYKQTGMYRPSFG